MKKQTSLSFRGNIMFIAVALCSLYMLFVNFNDIVSGKYLNAGQYEQYQGVYLSCAPYFCL